MTPSGAHPPTHGAETPLLWGRFSFLGLFLVPKGLIDARRRIHFRDTSTKNKLYAVLATYIALWNNLFRVSISTISEQEFIIRVLQSDGL